MLWLTSQLVKSSTICPRNDILNIVFPTIFRITTFYIATWHPDALVNQPATAKNWMPGGYVKGGYPKDSWKNDIQYVIPGADGRALPSPPSLPSAPNEYKSKARPSAPGMTY
jgi:hypothetical protein